MDLKIKDVAELLNVSETTVRRWVMDGKIPAYRLNHQYRFSSMEIEDWVMSQRLGQESVAVPFADDEDCDAVGVERSAKTSGGITQFSLYRSIYKGGVFHDVPGTTKEEVIKNTTEILAHRLDLDAEVLTELLVDREKMMPTALNKGIGVPHTRDFLLKKHFDVIAVVFPENPIEYGALDGLPVHTLFFLFACEDKRHLHLLAIAKVKHLFAKAIQY